MATQRYNKAEGGSNGTTPTGASGGNTGSTSGDFIDTINISGTGATMVFSNAQSAHGSLSYALASTSTMGSYLLWDTSVQNLTGIGATLYARLYWRSTLIKALSRIIMFTNSSIAIDGGIGVDATGHFTIVNSAATTVNTSTTVASANTWYRLEAWCKSDAAAGQIILRIYTSIDSTTAAETVTSATNLNTRGGNIAGLVFGTPSTTTFNATMYLDDIGASVDDWLGPAVGTTVTPSVLALTTSTFAPTVTAGSSGTTVTPSVLALTTATFAPTVTVNTIVTPSVLALTTTTFAPTVTVNTIVTPSTLALTTATFAPTVTAPTVVTPSVLALTISTFAPTVAAPTAVTPSALALTTATFAPTVTVNTIVTPSALALTISTFAPTVTSPTTLTPSTLALTIATFAPTVSAGGNQAVTPSVLALTVTTFAPTVATPTAVTPTKLSLVTATFAPTVLVAQNVTPSTLALTVGTFAPTVTAPTAITPALLALILTMYAPTVTNAPAVAAVYGPLLRWHELAAATHEQPDDTHHRAAGVTRYGEPRHSRWRTPG